MEIAEIVEFLEARFDEDEEVARAATPGPWTTSGDATIKAAAAGRAGVLTDEYTPRPNLAHIARHDPARVLREVEAKRRIIEKAETVSAMDSQIEGEWGGRDSVPEDEDEGIALLRTLASIYADHPDFREEWRP